MTSLSTITKQSRAFERQRVMAVAAALRRYVEEKRRMHCYFWLGAEAETL